MPNLKRGILRPRLAGPAALTMAWLNLGNAAVCEAAAESGVDMLTLDLQHGLWDRACLENALTAAGDVPVLVRVNEGTAVPISEALDAGAEGVIVPMVETAEEAAAAVSFARFAPLGKRSGGGVRPIAAGFADYVAASRTRTLIGIMIETAGGFANLDSILAVAGVDFIFIGTGDLAVSMGVSSGSSELEAAFGQILAACNARGMPCGLYTRRPEEAKQRAAAGYRLVVVSNDIGVVFGGFASAAAAYKG